MKVIAPRPLDAAAFDPFGSVFMRPNRSPLAETSAFSYWSDIARFAVDGDTEIGWCDVRAGGVANWFERHDETPEVLIPTHGPIALPVMDGSGEIAVFRIEVGQAVVLAESVWHSACMPIGRQEAGYFVLFRRETPASDVTKTEVEPFRVFLEDGA